MGSKALTVRHLFHKHLALPNVQSTFRSLLSIHYNGCLRYFCQKGAFLVHENPIS